MLGPQRSSAPALTRKRSNRSLSDTQKKDAILADPNFKLPSHFEAPQVKGLFGFIARVVFAVLCTCAYGQPDLRYMWASVVLAEQGDEIAWTEGRRRTSEQQNNILILAGLLLATSSVFITTPPPDANFLNYTRRGPYLCIYGAFGLLLGGIIVTSICVVVTSKITPAYTAKVLFRDKYRVYASLLILSYPSLCTSAATLIMAFGFLAGVWSADDLGFQLGALVILLLPVSIGLLFAFSSFIADAHLEKKNEKFDSLAVV